MAVGDVDGDGGRPRPTLATFWLREASRRLKGQRARTVDGMPGPSSSTVSDRFAGIALHRNADAPAVVGGIVD